MSDSATVQEQYAEKIRALLAKAESTEFAEEAEVFYAKAQELMAKYMIDQAMIDAARGKTDDVIGQCELFFAGSFPEDRRQIGSIIARANGCKCVYRNAAMGFGSKTIDGKVWRNWEALTVTGFQSDLERVQMLDTSVQIQLMRALKRWYQDNKKGWWSKGDSHRERREFIIGYGDGLRQKFTAANAAAKKSAAEEKARAEETTTAQATDSVALVLRTREDQVKDWYDKKYGTHLRSVSRRYERGSSGAYGAGHSAGSTANIGQTGLNGPGRQIGR